MIAFKQVTKTYPSGHTALNDVSFSIDDLPDHGEFISIIGPSGVGKSTLLMGMNATTSILDGSLKVLGNDVGSIRSLPPPQARANSCGRC